MKRKSLSSPKCQLQVEEIGRNQALKSDRGHKIDSFSQNLKTENSNSKGKINSTKSKENSVISSQFEEGKYVNSWIANIFNNAIDNLQDVDLTSVAGKSGQSKAKSIQHKSMLLIL